MLQERTKAWESAGPRTVQEIVALQSRHAPGRIALVEDARRCSYGELQNTLEITAEWLAQSGVRARDRVMLVCENSITAVALYFACTSLGAWPVIANARLSSREIDEIHEHSDSRLIVFTTACSLRAREHAKRYGAEAVPVLSEVVAAAAVNEQAERDTFEDDGQSDVAAIIYTTGTTGRPKGVVLTHGNLLFVARATAEARRLSPQDRVCATLPISHSLGLTGVLLGSLLSGAEIHLFSRFDPARIFAGLAASGLSVMIGTPSMYGLLAEHAKRNRLLPIAAPALRLISSAGAPLDAATKTEAEAAFGQTLHNGYGISECGPSIALTSLDSPRNDCSVGRLLPGVEARLVNDAGENHAGVGELWVRYHKAPEETRQVIDDAGWFRTGDLARMEDGHLFIVGRAKEMIIRFGFNVYPAEIEAVLNGHPKVLRSAVVGRAQSGTEDIIAFVQLTPGALATAAELDAHAASRLASYKRPSAIVLVGEMPMSANGKIRKAELLALCSGPR
jgi:long-chain acyl-CoA synthetase